MFRRRIEIKTPAQVEAMRESGLLVAGALAAITRAAVPGVTTKELDTIAYDIIVGAGARPSFLGYGDPPFPGSICASVNDEVVHGIPGPRRLEDGDLLSVDCGAELSGWHGDAAITLAIGTISAQDAGLSAATERALWAGLAAAQVGNKLSDIGHAIEVSVASEDVEYGNVDDYGGHFIGSRMHMEPSVGNSGPPGFGPKLVPGMVLAIEPMLTRGSASNLVTLDDDWTVVTPDRARAAHWEHTVAVTAGGPWVLTAADGGASMFATLGLPSPALG